MAYTLDIVTDPADAVPQDAAVTPLYRTRFTTSRYASMDDLAGALGGSEVTHRFLNKPLALPAPVAVGQRVSDQDIQSAFTAAGEQALPAPSANRITIYWVPGAGSGAYVPHCVLIDCTEPLWRWRQEPMLTAPEQDDPSFEIVTVSAAAALTVTEVTSGGPASIGGFYYSTSGTRTIAVLAAGFAPPAAGTTVSLALHRPASTVFPLTDHVAPIIGLVIGPNAPWEADNA
jgi:hypothetical protein